MLRGAMDGSISRFLGDFFLYYASVRPHSFGRGDQYEMVIRINQVAVGWWRRGNRMRTHSFQFRFSSPFAYCFKESEHSTLQWFGRILPGYILEVG